MYVVKRDGTKQPVAFDKVSYRIRNICTQGRALVGVNSDLVSRKIIECINDGISTSELDVLGASLVQPMLLEHPDYGELASRLLVSNYHKNCNQLLIANFSNLPEATESHIVKNLFYYTCRMLWENLDINGNHAPIIAPHIMRFVEDHKDLLEQLLNYSRDYMFTYPGFELARGSYLLQCSVKTQLTASKEGDSDLDRCAIERPQHMWLRVALGIWLTYPTIPYRVAHTQAIESCLLTKTYWNDIKDACDTKIDQDIYNRISKTYELLSKQMIMHATPTLFHSGMITPQLSSCFLTTIKQDSLKGIAYWFDQIMETSKWAGGIGSHIHHIRPEGSYISGTAGTSNGLIPMLRCVNEIAKYVDQGGSKRPGSHAIYLEVWHGDIEPFIDIRRQRGNLANKAPALYNAIWMCDEFMRTVEEEERRIKMGEKDVRMWYLMDPSRCPGLPDNYDQILHIGWISDAELEIDDDRFAFTKLYRNYIKAGKFMRRISAIDLWRHICEVTEETSIPYLVFKDSTNRKSNQKNVGTIKSSNLCCEITEYSDGNETAVCNLASICCEKYVTFYKPTNADKYPFPEGFSINTDIFSTQRDELGLKSQAWFDFEELVIVIKDIVVNLDRIIDQNYYPTTEECVSNMRHRPIGIGIQGLADCFARLWLPFDSEDAMKLDYYIFEHMDFASKESSMSLAKKFKPYSTFAGSPTSEGKFQIDLWIDEYNRSDQKDHIPDWNPIPYPLTCDWDRLSEEVKINGLRNSLTLAPMPTASTSTLTSCSPAIEPFNAMLYKHTDKYGESFICNKELQNTLIIRGLWTIEVRQALMRSRTGSIQDITTIPRCIRDIFKNAWDMSPKVIINHSLRRGCFIDQSQSLNWFVAEPTAQIITQGSFYAWKRGIKTGRYYLRRLPKVDAKKIQLINNPVGLALSDTNSITKTQDPEYDGDICTMKDGCLTCGS